MKFKYGTRRRAIEYEKDIVVKWKKNKTFEKSVEQRPSSNSYVFYDGPPFITGVPHHGTLLSSIVKDAVPRYHTMKGKHVERVWGWDCHGLPAEVFTEKKLGIKDRRDIGTKISLEEYITTCRDNMVQTGSLWEDTIDRIGRWVDFKGAYKTMDKEYMESIWWAFKTLYEKKKIYEGERVLMYCTRDATPLSKAEVTMDAGAYQDVTDPSVYFKFKVEDEDAYFLVWTTMPWTLGANTALAVSKRHDYAKVKVGDEVFYIASELVAKAMIDDKKQPIEHEVIEVVSGADMVGRRFKPFIQEVREDDPHFKNAYKLWDADFVTVEDGTGIVSIAPGFGEDDFNLAKANDIPVVMHIDENGRFLSGEWRGQVVWDVNKDIAKTLLTQGNVWKIHYYRHSYPHCHRCGTRLMYRAHPSWFMDIDGQREQMLVENTEHVTWFPEHIKHGRFEKTVEQAPDWNLSRDRFWATAMPVWEGTDKDGKKHQIVVGSYQELKELSGKELDDYHRPWVDDIEFEKDGVRYRRIEKVLDGWFESGSMPFAQFHYPFENVEKFEANFPGDFIAEYVGQVRAWFYYLHAVNVGLFGKNAFKNVIVTGTLAGNDGRKMSKSYGNYTDPNVLMDQYSADSLRLLLLGSPVLNGEDFSLQDKEVADTARKLSMVWNMYDFFTMYAEVDGWEFDGKLADPSETLDNPLDQWIVSRVHQLNREVERHMDGYDLPNAVKPILPFIEDASNWYVRRSRRRFWKSGDDTDKHNAYRTLHYVLVHLAQVMAPFTPFLSEELYQKLTGGESVHLTDWPLAGHVNELVTQDMETVREYVNQGLSIRAREHLKVRQPLASVAVPRLGQFVNFEDILKDELNVKAVQTGKEEVALDVNVTPALKREGLAREVIRHVQNARKQAGLNVDDRIRLGLDAAESDLRDAINEHRDTIMTETLAEEVTAETYSYEVGVKVEGAPLRVALQKA